MCWLLYLVSVCLCGFFFSMVLYLYKNKWRFWTYWCGLKSFQLETGFRRMLHTVSDIFSCSSKLEREIQNKIIERIMIDLGWNMRWEFSVSKYQTKCQMFIDVICILFSLIIKQSHCWTDDKPNKYQFICTMVCGPFQMQQINCAVVCTSHIAIEIQWYALSIFISKSIKATRLNALC